MMLSNQPVPSLQVALQRDWRCLMGLVIFPPTSSLATYWFNAPFFIFVPFFFLAIFYAGYPYLSGRAPLSFWTCGGGVAWFAGTMLASLGFHLSGWIGSRW